MSPLSRVTPPNRSSSLVYTTEKERMSAPQSSGGLSDVPEEAPLTPASSPAPPTSPVVGPYGHATHHQAAASTSTFRATSPSPTSGSQQHTNGNGATSPTTQSSAVSRKSSSRLGRETTGSNGSLRKQALASSTSTTSLTITVRDGKTSSKGESRQKIRNVPRLPHSDLPHAPPTFMYWSKAPVYGQMPTRGMRAHSVTLVDHVAWLFGGCDDKGCWQDVYCFDTETMHWSQPKIVGDIPPPCRAHTATLVDRKIVVFGGGQGPTYYDKTYVLDTTLRRWIKCKIQGTVPAPRRAHTAVLYRGKIWIFGGGNGMQALNDTWTLDVGNGLENMKWEKVETRGRKPSERGYHTANLIGNVMIVLGGSDGRECFSDVWCLNLDNSVWSMVKLEQDYRRLSHSSTQVGSYLFVVGGHDGTSYTSELLLYNLVSLQYEKRETKGKPPSTRGYHAAIVTDSRLFLFGGFNGHDVHEDVHILDLAGAAYLPQVVSFSIDVS